MRSNVWPGLFAFAAGHLADVIYIGWGHKYVARNFKPAPLPPQQVEYAMASDGMEINDPTVEEEEEYRKKLEIDQLVEDDDTNDDGDDDGNTDSDETDETDEGSETESEEN